MQTSARTRSTDAVPRGCDKRLRRQQLQRHWPRKGGDRQQATGNSEKRKAKSEKRKAKSESESESESDQQAASCGKRIATSRDALPIGAATPRDALPIPIASAAPST
jgi:hypothetical protein